MLISVKQFFSSFINSEHFALKMEHNSFFHLKKLLGYRTDSHNLFYTYLCVN